MRDLKERLHDARADNLIGQHEYEIMLEQLRTIEDRLDKAAYADK